MADLAIGMAGHVSAPLYPMQSADNSRQIAGHGGMVACFIGKLDAVDLLDGLTPAIVRLPAARAMIEADPAIHPRAVNATPDPHEKLEYLVISTKAWTPENGMLTPTLKARRASIEKHFAARIET